MTDADVIRWAFVVFMVISSALGAEGYMEAFNGFKAGLQRIFGG